ncbi:M16 family metallopeptidase [Aliikangiella coralliicola]|uniref:Insulinase family protein n=1 Tax=Aliikangiella coralliicola TaxID=2592383 RepID=A0A545UK34_9GAMM|nr:pitrilysin family protein [Aliikangiella coralliicola]TQV89821.1 insulinase family protein [Aliikangiella coralliicola]
MKIITLGISIILTLISPLVSAAFKIPEYQSLKLDNGLQIYLMQQSEVPLIDVQLTVRAGAVDDQGAFGLANITGEALMFGSGKLSKVEVEDLLAFHGAELSSFTDTEMSTLSMSFAAKDQKKLMTLFRDVALKPTFSAEEFTKFKKRYISQLTQSRESPRNIVGNLFQRMYYGEHPYGNPVSGDISTVEKINISHVKDFYQKYYTPNNSALIVVGDFNAKKIKKQLKQLFGQWRGKAPEDSVLSLVNNKTESGVWLVDKDDANETTFMIGGKGINANHPDYVSAQVINTILGARFTSWLNEELRTNTGLTYGARSGFSDNSTAGSFTISTFTKTETTFEAIDLAIKTYHKLWEKGIDAETLKSAKAYVKGQFPPRFETSQQLARLLGRMWALKLSDSIINDFQQKVDSLDVKKANQLVKQLFPKENLQFVLVGKASEIREKAKAYGKLKEMNIKTFNY